MVLRRVLLLIAGQVTGDLWERYLTLIADPRKTDG